MLENNNALLVVVVLSLVGCFFTGTSVLAGPGPSQVIVVNPPTNPVPVTGTVNVGNQYIPVGRDCANPPNLYPGADLERCPLWIYPVPPSGEVPPAGYGMQLPNVNLAFANLRGALMAWDNLAGAILWNADLTGANLYRARLTNAYLPYANLTGTDLRGANLMEARLNVANLTGANMRSASMRLAGLASANLTGADLTLAVLDDADLSGANLFQANLYKASLVNVIWGNHTKCPDGTYSEVNDPINPTCVGHLGY